MSRSVAILDDVLRDEPNGLVHHVTNRRWLAAMVQSLAGEVFAVREFGFDVDGDGHFDVAACMAALGLKGRCLAHRRGPSERLCGPHRGRAGVGRGSRSRAVSAASLRGHGRRV